MKSTAKKLIVAAAFVPTVAFAWPWSTDMMNQPSIKPQEGTPAAFPTRSIPVQGIPTQASNREETRGMKNPIEPTEASLAKGKDLFKIICGACHGNDGTANNPVAERIGAISLVDDYVQELDEGWIWGTITFGSYVMPAYGVPGPQGGSNDLSPEERWHVVNYLKHQLVKDTAASDAVASNE